MLKRPPGRTSASALSVCQSISGPTVAGIAHFDYAHMPNDAKAWGVFDLQRAAGAGEITVDANEVVRLTEAYRVALAESPPPA